MPVRDVVSQLQGIATGPTAATQALQSAGVRTSGPEYAAAHISVSGLGTSQVVDIIVTDPSALVAQKAARVLAGAVVSSLNKVGQSGLSAAMTAIDSEIVRLTEQRAVLASQVTANPWKRRRWRRARSSARQPASSGGSASRAAGVAVRLAHDGPADGRIRARPGSVSARAARGGGLDVHRRNRDRDPLATAAARRRAAEVDHVAATLRSVVGHPSPRRSAREGQPAGRRRRPGAKVLAFPENGLPG
jgi:hypothetical protein